MVLVLYGGGGWVKRTNCNILMQFLKIYSFILFNHILTCWVWRRINDLIFLFLFPEIPRSWGEATALMAKTVSWRFWPSSSSLGLWSSLAAWRILYTVQASKRLQQGAIIFVLGSGHCPRNMIIICCCNSFLITLF